MTKPNLPYEPQTCMKCSPGRMVWHSSNLRNNGTMIEHTFACDNCGAVERVNLPVEP